MALATESLLMLWPWWGRADSDVTLFLVSTVAHPVSGSCFMHGRDLASPPQQSSSSCFCVFFPGHGSELLFAGHSTILTQYK